MTINLIPPKLKREKELEKIANLAFTSLFIVLVVLLIITGTIFSANMFAERDLQNIQTKIDDQKKTLKKYDELGKKVDTVNGKLDTINSLIQNRVTWSTVMAELGKDTPSQVQIKTLAANSTGNKLTITGAAQTRTDIANFKEKLESSSLFQNVVFSSSSLNEQTNDYSFDLSCELKGRDKK